MKPEEEFLSTRAVSQRYNIAEITLRTWRRRGAGPSFVRFGRAIRYRLSDIERWLAGNTVASAESQS